MVKKIALIFPLVVWLFTWLMWTEVNAGALPPEASPPISCIKPQREQAQACAEQAQQILDSTIRIEMHGWVEVNGEHVPLSGRSSHATIKGGRYLVTHNHFKYPLRATEQSHYTAISLYRANGDIIMEKAPLTTFNIVVEDSAMLVLEFTDDTGQGLFESLGLPSARFRSWHMLDLQPGAEVAQILWNGRDTSVQWTVIQKVVSHDRPRIELHSMLGAGSSGGGVFWQGQHIGNNLSRTWVRDRQNQIIRHFSTAALNEMPPETVVCLYLDYCPANVWTEETQLPASIWRSWRPI